MSSNSCVKTEIRGFVRWIRLNRPTVMNAVNEDLLDQLEAELIDSTGDDGTRVVVIASTSRNFCAGGDLKSLLDHTGELDSDRFALFLKKAYRVIERIRSIPKPVIAAVDGVAVAGGLEIVLACDLVIASENSRIGDAHINYGLFSGARLSREFGSKFAKYLLFTGCLQSAAQFVSLGVVNEVVPEDELEARVTDIASVIGNKSPLCLARGKGIVNDSLDLPLEEALQMEIDSLVEHSHSQDALEGISAFREKRRPKYLGS